MSHGNMTVVIEITIDAEMDEKQFKSTITFEGTRDDIMSGVCFIEENAGRVGLSPQQFVEATLTHLPMTGFLPDEAAQQIQIMAIIYAVMNLGNGKVEIEDQDSIATLTIRDTEMIIAFGNSA